MTIRLLPAHVTGKIAAGEVIERPASVVKELVENSLDAGASVISIELAGGGRDLIRVSDDGCGIEPEELPLALRPHATSKLQSEDDLLRIKTLGFRGEALASMAAVAEVAIASAVGDGLRGRRIVARGDAILADEPHGGARGTRVEVKGLFSGFPVRLEFLKSERTESYHVLNVVHHLAIAHPSVRCRLLVDGRASFQTPGMGSARDALLAVVGLSALDDLLEIGHGEFRGIEGFVSQPGKDRATRNHIAFFVNRRWVSNPTLSGALSEAYRGLLPAGRHPAAFLFLEMPPEDVDVNVHPTKAEVRFRDGAGVFSRLSTAIRRTLVAKAEFVPLAVEAQRPVVDEFFIPAQLTRGGVGIPGQAAPMGRAESVHRAEADSEAAGADTGLRSPRIRALGHIEHTYIVATGPDGLYLIDQHTAHERVNYEELLTANGEPDRQRLLTPATVELGAAGSAWASENLQLLQSLGLELEHFGGGTWLVRSVPSMASGRDAAGFAGEVVGELSQTGDRRSDVGERARWSVACKSAVKAGDALALPEMQALLERLARCDLGRTCPHGRPTTLKLSRELLDRQFGR